MKRVLLASLLATLLGGCVVVPWGYGYRDRDDYHHYYGDGGYHRGHDRDRWNDRWNDERHWDHGR